MEKILLNYMNNGWVLKLAKRIVLKTIRSVIKNWCVSSSLTPAAIKWKVGRMVNATAWKAVTNSTLVYWFDPSIFRQWIVTQVI